MANKKSIINDLKTIFLIIEKRTIWEKEVKENLDIRKSMRRISLGSSYYRKHKHRLDRSSYWRDKIIDDIRLIMDLYKQINGKRKIKYKQID